MTIYHLTFKCDFGLQPTNLRIILHKESKYTKNIIKKKDFFFFWGGGGGGGGIGLSGVSGGGRGK